MSSSLYHRLQGIFSKSPLPTTTTTPTQISTTLKSLSPKERALQKLAANFKIKSSESAKFRCNYRVYEYTVRRLASAKQFSMIEDILESQKKYENISNERFAIRLISLYGKSGMFSHAHKLFDEMPELNCERTVMSFNALLAACINSKEFNKVDEIFKELPAKLSLEPDLVSYNTVIKAFCEMGSMDYALPLLDEMEKRGMDPDLITFNTLLDAFYRNNQFSDGEKIWAMMERKSFSHDVRSYNSKLRGLVFEGRMNEAIELFEELRTKGLTPDVFSFNALIKGFCGDGSLKEARRWYKELVECKCSPDWVTFTTLVPCLCERGEFDMAFELCKHIIKRRCIVDTVLMQVVVDGLIKESKIEVATELVEVARSNNYYRYKLELSLDK